MTHHFMHEIISK
jgi:hypothetical protein